MNGYLASLVYTYRELDDMFEDVINREMEYFHENGEVSNNLFWRSIC